MTLFTADGSGRHVPANTSNHFKSRLFRLHNPARREPPQKAVDVFPRTITHIKIQGFPESPPLERTFPACGKSPESPVFKPFFRRSSVFYIRHQYYALNVARAAWIDVLSCFLNLTFTGTYQWIFGIFPENGRSRKQIDQRLRRSSICFIYYKINCYSINDFIISISCLSVCLYLSRLLSSSTIPPSITTSASASTTIDMPFSTYTSFLT